MNILIVGNGFDLSHYLPTKYDHFMVAMGAIEKWDIANGEISFDDLFGSLYEKEDYFFGYTKAMYKTDEIKISVEQTTKLKKQLEENVWYQYFADHVREVKTWIDFEQKIEEALLLVTMALNRIEEEYLKSGLFNLNIFIGDFKDLKGYQFSELQVNLLSHLKLFKKNDNYGHVANNTYRRDIKAGKISANFFKVKNIEKYGFDSENYLIFLQNQLEDFIKLFNLYLDLIIDKLKPNCKFNIDSKDFLHPNKIYSFNYTNTYQKFYDYSAETDYLHGNFGEKQNIVLGVSDLKDESLKKLKAYGFTKYHQKLFNETDYLFLDSYKSDVVRHKRKIEYFEKDFGSHDPLAKKFERQSLMEVDSKLNLNISIWGHSLDLSDQDYIQDIFSLNDDIDRNVQVIIYYFDKNAKFALLNNLLAILKKDKVERWMKNKWLQFKKNPEIKFTEAIL